MSAQRVFYRSSASSSRSTSPSPPPLFPGMVNPQDPPPYSRRGNIFGSGTLGAGLGHSHSTNNNSNNSTTTGSNTKYGHRHSHSHSHPSTMNTATNTSSNFFSSSTASSTTGSSNSKLHSSKRSSLQVDPQSNTSRHLRSLSNSSNQSDLPSALVDKQVYYYQSPHARSWRRRLLSRQALSSFLILGVLSICLILYLQPSAAWGRTRSDHDRSYYDRNGNREIEYDFPMDPLKRTRSGASWQQDPIVGDAPRLGQERERHAAPAPEVPVIGRNRGDGNNGHESDYKDNHDVSLGDDGHISTLPVPGELNHNRDSSSSNSNSKSSPLADSSHQELDPESIVLYRILGNDLPPRHRPGQTLSNVRFILEHEPEFEKTQKLWVLNRIVDPNAENSIIALLVHHQQQYIRIPFQQHDYLQKDFRLEDFPEPDFFSSDDFSTFSKVAKLRVLDYTYHDKNNYVMNNNGGRNVAIQHGRTVNARWIMAFDGNSFLTKNAMAEIKASIHDHGESVKYFVVPMARLVDNSQLLKGTDTRPNSKEEPQIIFKNDAKEFYNPEMRYGRRSKLELLWRLGALERSKISKPSVPWELPEREPLNLKDEFKVVGWVFRLFSGKRLQEENTRQSAAIRAYNRLLAIQDLIDGIDEKIARKTFSPSSLLVYTEDVLVGNRQKYWAGEEGVTVIVNDLQTKACTVLSRRANLLKKTLAEDLLLLPADAQGRAIVPPAPSTDSEAIPDTKTITLQGIYDEVVTLTMAHYFTGNETFSRAAANIVRTTLLQEHDQHIAIHPQDEDMEYLLDHGYSFPALNRLPRVIRKKEGSIAARPLLSIPKDLLKADNLPAFLDTVRMLHRIQVLTQNEYIQLLLVFSTWLEHMVNSPEGIQLAKQGDHRSTYMDLNVAALAAITDDVRLFLRVVNRSRMRVGRQFIVIQDGKIKMPFEHAFSTRKSMAGLLQPGGANTDVMGQELGGMYADEENDDVDGSTAFPTDQVLSTLKSKEKENVESLKDFDSLNKDQHKLEIDELTEEDGTLPVTNGQDLLQDTPVVKHSEETESTSKSAPKSTEREHLAETEAKASSTPHLVTDSEPLLTVPEMVEKYSSLNLQYWTTLTRMVGNANMGSAPDLWRHRTKRGYRLGDIVRNYLRQDHYVYNMSNRRKVTRDALLYMARSVQDHVPRKVYQITDGTDEYERLHGIVHKSTGSKAQTWPGSTGALDWGDLGRDEDIMQEIARDEEDLRDSLGGNIKDNGVPPFVFLSL